MKPRATFHWLWLAFWCAVSLGLWCAAYAGLRALGLAPWQALVELVLMATAGVAWVMRRMEAR